MIYLETDRQTDRQTYLPQEQSTHLSSLRQWWGKKFYYYFHANTFFCCGFATLQPPSTHGNADEGRCWLPASASGGGGVLSSSSYLYYSKLQSSSSSLVDHHRRSLCLGKKISPHPHHTWWYAVTNKRILFYARGEWGRRRRRYCGVSVDDVKGSFCRSSCRRRAPRSIHGWDRAELHRWP